MNTFLFDFDGTLVDSMPTYVSSMLQILDDAGISYGPDIIKIITPLGMLGTARYYRQLGVPFSEEEILKRMEQSMLEEYYHSIPAKPGVAETLRKLKAAGASLSVLTASPHITLDACLKRLELYDLFDHVWSCDDFSTTKADPDIYRQAARRIGVPVEHIWFLDDNYNADATAKRAGMKVCGVYDVSSADYTAEIQAVSDAYITEFSELWTLREQGKLKT